MALSVACPAKLPPLTPVEVEIVLQIVAGHSARRAALELNLSEDEVQIHLLAIFEKTGCDTRTQLAAAWCLYGQERAPASPAELHAQIDRLEIENNALRQRARELQTALDYLSDHPRIRQRPDLQVHSAVGLSGRILEK